MPKSEHEHIHNKIYIQSYFTSHAERDKGDTSFCNPFNKTGFVNSFAFASNCPKDNTKQKKKTQQQTNTTTKWQNEYSK